MAVSLDVQRFKRRLQSLYVSWKDPLNEWNKSSTLIFTLGNAGEELLYSKSSSMFLWMLGYEFTDTLFAFTKKEFHIIAGSKKLDILKQLDDTCKEAGISMHFHEKPKKDNGKLQMEQLIEVIKAAADLPVIGTLQDNIKGDFGSCWSDKLAASGMQVMDIAKDVGTLLLTKDEDEVKNIRKAAYLVSAALQRQAVKQLEDTIEEEKSTKHSALAKKLEEAIQDPSSVNVRLKADLVDIAYHPIFQSGGEYKLEPFASSNDDPVDYGVIICQAGARYSSYCANVGRTYFVNPTTDQEKAYNAILTAQTAAIAALVENAEISRAYEAALESLKDRYPKLLDDGNFPKDIGAGIGIELRDNNNLIDPGSLGKAKAGMAFNVTLGVKNLTADGKEYAILVSDTVVVTSGGGPPDVSTALAMKDWKDVAYYLHDEHETESPLLKDENVVLDETNLPVRKSARTEQVDFKAREEERRRQRENQEDLLDKVNQATLQFLTKGSSGGASGAANGRKITDLVAYKSVNELQHNGVLALQVDHKNECLLAPIYGVLVPFHILTVKNATYNQENDHAYVRINFNFGGSWEPSIRFPQVAFVKELSFRTADIRHAQKIVQEIKALRSQVQQRDKESAERATLVQQEKLVKGKGRVHTLPDVWIRPAFGGKGRKVAGSLEAHANGFRYTSPKGEELDIMYRNIKHAFYQPAENEMITLVHFHLKNPIMVGKKKTADVQFYSEVMDSVQTLDAGRRSLYDPDEIEEEQRERERRNQINRQFNQFAKRVQQDVWERDFGDLNLEFEIPFRELGFSGVPSRSTAFIMPTVNCLVELTEMPFTVITLTEVNVVNLERVGFNLRNFDMIFVWKDLNRDVGRIDAIPSHHLETIKDWLTSIEIKYYESKVNLNWKNIIKMIKEDPEGFVEDGGWNFLDADQSDSEEEEGEEESEFEPSDEGEDVESEEDESSEDESVVESDDESEAELDSDEEEGLDWDELEEQARNDDKSRSLSDDEEPNRKRKHQGSAKSGKKMRS